MFNYDNIGGKVKDLARATFVLGAIAAVIAGLLMLMEGVENDEILIWYGLLTMIAGPIVAYVSSWILYAFGELVENSTSLNKKIPDMTKTMLGQAAQAPVKAASRLTKPAPRPAASHSWRCDRCGQMTSKSPCEHCGGAEPVK